MAVSFGMANHPSYLYHYTTGPGLASILLNQELWASDSRCLNDVSEFTLGHAELNAALSAVADEISERVPRHDLDDSPKEISDYVRSLASGGPGQQAPFVACFCAKGDLLSLWRAYGGGAYSIGFRAQHLSGLSQPRRALYFDDGQSDDWPGISDATPKLAQVRYGPSGVEQMVAEVRDFYLGLKSAPRQNNWHSSALPAYVGRSTVKHEAFADEREWRLVVDPDAIDARYRFDGQSTLIPYAPLEFDRDAVESVRVGPRMRTEAAASVRRFLDQHGYRHVKVENSVAPLR